MKLELAISVGLLAVTASAQTHLTTPKSGTETEGAADTSIFGWAANQGHRFLDATHVGTARKIRGVSFRLDDRDHNAIGRTWSNVKVWIAHGDYGSIQYNKSSQFTLKDSKVLVFDQRWSFPALKGRPPLQPAPWGGLRNSLSFRFAKEWNYNGKDAIFLEFQFSGGTADNNVPWIGPTPKGFEYHLDSMPQSSWRGDSGNEYFPPKNKSTPCYDSAYTGKNVAGMDVKLEATSRNVDLTAYSYNTAPSSPVIYALGLAGNRNGLNVGAGCNAFYVDLAKPMVLLIVPGSAKGYAFASVRAPRDPAITEFWLQTAWFDSRTARPKLTNAVRASLGGGEVPAVTSYVASSDGKFSVWTAAAKGMPFIRYDL